MDVLKKKTENETPSLLIGGSLFLLYTQTPIKAN